MSKSKGNTVDPLGLIDKYGAGQPNVRYSVVTVLKLPFRIVQLSSHNGIAERSNIAANLSGPINVRFQQDLTRPRMTDIGRNAEPAANGPEADS
jgi:hypothetical protein